MRKRLTAAILIILIFAAVLSGCGKSASLPFPPAASPASPETDKQERYSGYIFDAFDTVITVTAYCASQEEFDALLKTAEDEFTRYHRMFDIYFTYPGVNNLKTVNDNAGISPVKVSDELIDFLSFAKEMYGFTDGRMNVAMGSVLSIWHDIREYNSVMTDDIRLPDEDELYEAAQHCRIDDIVIDSDSGTVFLKDEKMSLDVGAVAKGYATERVVELIAGGGCESFAINAGGNVRVYGTKPGGASWVVAVTNPELTGDSRALGSVDVSDCSVVTSGTYQRFFEYEGRRYHHIIDGDTLMPENRYMSVTVVTHDSGYADALSTALFNMEFDDGYAFVEGLDDVEAMWVLPDGSIVTSAGFCLEQ